MRAMQGIVLAVLVCPSLVVAQEPPGGYRPADRSRVQFEGQAVSVAEQVAGSTASVTIRWAAVDGANSYRVSRAVAASGPFAPVGSVSVPEFTDQGLVPGYRFHYQILPSAETNPDARMTVAPSTSGTRVADHRSGDVTLLQSFAPIAGIASTAPAPAFQVATGTNCIGSRSDVKTCDFSWPAVPGAVAYRIYRRSQWASISFCEGPVPDTTLAGGPYRTSWSYRALNKPRITCAVFARAIYRMTHAGAGVESEGPDAVFPFP
jgi:hypothetical protein